ncbi:B-cell receptor-associated protein, putative [Entamoeba invadens IP1]|uniref:B-cell receptor-associated protein, putative n=1 Tax=Entamoeba invadens IP1 TaxID=370355 RepID=UPI0002C3E5E2|nr:B-cell receptor-associated protein, putative [Entamoeba invadens IP1]ELP93235.1 B-cell receptor-associated protein, putative [Entamoeba invadens IP1]|eukprot:XP_004260006.1 B-cell receptor-associated protein, putative [Entamoeba invadens IP1]
MATFVWTAVYTFLWAEIAVLFLLLVPLPAILARQIPKILRKVFSNRTIFGVILVLLTLCFAESLRSSYKYSTQLSQIDADDPILNKVTISLNKFRAERNIYLSGYTLFFIFVIWRVCVLQEEVENQKAVTNKVATMSEKETAEQPESSATTVTQEPTTDDKDHPKSA